MSISKFLSLFTCLLILTFSGCTSEDESGSIDDAFMDGALTSATNQQLEGRWSIYQAEYEGEVINIPSNFPECGRDFFDYRSGGNYREYIFDDNFECTPQINLLNWSLSGGVLTLSNGSASEDFVITELTENRLVFKLRADVDQDGNLDIMSLICNRYEPPTEIDMYSGSFYWNSMGENNDKILLEWDKYQGYNEFVKYEIYRLGEGCNNSDMQLITTITDVNQNQYIDLNPPAQDEICYVFKIYTNQGLLGESQPITVFTSSIQVPLIQLAAPVISNGTIQLNWQQFSGYYFSKYEIEVRNYSSGSGGGYQEEVIAEINSLGTISYLDEEPPYFANPVYVIHAYNIFGTRNSMVIEGQNQRSTIFVRDEILPFDRIRDSVFDPNETILYFYAEGQIHRYNYATQTLEHSTPFGSSSIQTIEVINSSQYGKELIVVESDISVYYAQTLELKYQIQIDFVNEEHLAVKDGYWLITDRQKLYSYTRNNSILTLNNSHNLYNESFNISRINVMDIGGNRILVGNHTQNNGLILEMDANGYLSSNAVSVPMNLTSQWDNNSLFSDDLNYVLNVEGNTLYSTQTHNLIANLAPNYFSSGISSNGSTIFGSNNNTGNDPDGLHERKARFKSFPNLNETVYETKGYPHIFYQNHLGQIISISKGLVGTLDGYSVSNDIFIEVIN